MMFTKPIFTLTLLYSLAACGGGDPSGFVCTAKDSNNNTVWYNCDWHDYNSITHKVPVPLGYYVRSFYDDSNMRHVEDVRAYTINGAVYAKGSDQFIGGLADNSFLVRTGDNFYISE